MLLIDGGALWSAKYKSHPEAPEPGPRTVPSPPMKGTISAMISLEVGESETGGLISRAQNSVL